jgi:hypothetical protein
MRENALSSKLLVWMALPFLVVGGAKIYYPGNAGKVGVRSFPHTVLVMVLTLAWCKYHAAENAVPLFLNRSRS